MTLYKTFQLALCEVFHPIIHGYDENSSSHIYNQFLVYTHIKLTDFYSGAYLLEESSRRRYAKAIRILHTSLENTHPTIRSYTKVNMKYARLEIIQTDILSGKEEVAYLKTFWLRLVQRRWKKIYKTRQEILKQRKNIQCIREKERTGKWPVYLQNWPNFN